MLLSLEKNFLFVHVPKTAGTSLTEVLAPYALAKNRTPLRRVTSWLPVRENPARAYFRQHDTAAHIRRKLPAALWDRLHKFAAIRNPYDYAVSYYAFTQNNPSSRRYREAQGWTFGDFLDYFERKDRLMPRAQSAWITDASGAFLVDRLLFVETLASDFDALARQLGLPEGTVLPHSNKSPRKPYQDYYTAALRAQVERIYALDFKHFGYDFDTGLPTANPLTPRDTSTPLA